jgi:hypothetical protein
MAYKTLVVIALFLAVSVGATAADITGMWTAQVPGRNGVRDTKFNLKVDGDKLTGTMGVDGQDTAIADGKVSGDTVSFTANVDRGGNMVKYSYTGKIAGDEIQFKREGGPGQAREFTAKRAK